MKAFTFIAFTAAIAALSVAASVFSAPAQAQDDTYVDLSIEITVGSSFVFTARNQGTADAYGVTVDIELADQTIEGHGDQFKENSDTTCSGNIPFASATTSTCATGVWTVGALEPGEERELTITPRLAAGLECCSASSDTWPVPARAEIKNRVPEEEERFKGDNTAVGWISVSQGSSGTSAAEADYRLEASVNNLLPEPGATVTFTFKVRRPAGAAKSVYGGKVRLKLDSGMGTPAATPSTETFAEAPGLTRTWDWDFDLEDTTVLKTLEVSTTLAKPLPDGISRSDLCLTAELTAERPDDHTPGDTSAEFCFKDDPVVLLQEGQIKLFAIYPCVDFTDYPCSSDDTVEMRVIGYREDSGAAGAAMAAGIARDEAVLKPDRVLVQVKDPEGRRIDTYSNEVNSIERGSVNSGTAPSWHTARADHGDIDSSVGGVKVLYTREKFTSTQKTKFSKLDRTVTLTVLDGGTGQARIRWPVTGNTEFIPGETRTRTQDEIGDFNDGGPDIFSRFVEFSTLGTYRFDYIATLTHTDTTNHPNPYSSNTGSYTFHVGPVSELAVSDGDGGLAPAGTRAFNIVAVNNGPDDAPAVKVSLSGLDAGSCTGNSTKGSIEFDNGECVWTIGELREPDYQQNIYGRDGEVLTIITSAAVGAEITATISNEQDYEVCIDSEGEDAPLDTEAGCDDVDATWDATAMTCTASHGRVLNIDETACGNYDADWHTTKYYDYISENDSATIKAKTGTGEGLPSLRGEQSKTTSVVVRWAPVAEVNGRKRTHYQVQKLTDSWTTVALALETNYVDTGVAAGDTPRYRARAINDRGQEGPWSAPVSVTGSHIFHVGPASELEVSDGDASRAQVGTRAFTIVAVNNGPDDAPAVEVNLTGLNSGDYVSHSATAGAFDSSAGVWTIGELRDPGYYQDIYGRDGETLTIITSAAVDAEITARISNEQDYEVCIDSSGDDVKLSSPSETACTTEDATNTWHTAKYYDYVSENNSAKIKAKDGARADLLSLRGEPVQIARVIISWSPVEEVNGRDTTHYEVQRETNPWTTVALALETNYVDTGVAAGDTPRYRVRAINDRGQEGPWSEAVSVSVSAAPEPTPTPTPEPRRSDPEPSNTSPRFTDGGSTTRHIQENSEPGTDVGSPVAATDKNRDRLTYALTGTDADSFEIVASSGQIRTKAELDYETKTRYRVTVTVSDGKNSRGEPNESVDDVIDVTIAVTNQGEQGSITFSEALPVVGTAIGAKLTDPDGGLSRVSWAWERSADGDAWAGISGAASASYTPADGDAGHYLRVTASYTDGHGPSKSATAALSVPVTALSVSQRYDGDGDGAISLGEALKAAGDYRDGIITYEEAIAVANLYFESQS